MVREMRKALDGELASECRAPRRGVDLRSVAKHLVLWRAFWAPLLVTRPEMRSATFAALALSEYSPGLMRLAFAALAEPSAAAWPLRVRAARL